jgi:dimethylglycine dehydrogenase
LLEKAELTSGSTWHAAGQITHSTSSFGWANASTTISGSIPARWRPRPASPVTWHGCGSFRLAYTEDEMDWLRQTLSVGRRWASTSSWSGRFYPRSCTRSTISMA